MMNHPAGTMRQQKAELFPFGRVTLFEQLDAFVFMAVVQEHMVNIACQREGMAAGTVSGKVLKASIAQVGLDNLDNPIF
jgi:hypothetical protein